MSTEDCVHETDGKPSPQPHSKAAIDWAHEKDEEKPGLCCLQGCLAVSAVGFSFFVALPTGIILVVLAVNSDDTVLLSVGAVLIALPVLMLIIVVILCLNQKRLCCLESKRKTTPTSRGAAAQTSAKPQVESPA